MSPNGHTPSIPPTPYSRMGDGPPLVLLHGATMSWQAWRPVLSLLATRHDVIALTLPGHRGGPELAHPSVSAIVDGVEESLDQLGLGRVHVAGNSLGGWVSVELMRRDRALSATLFSPAGCWPAAHLTAAAGASAAALLGAAITASRVGTLAPPAMRHLALRHIVHSVRQVPPAELRAMAADAAACTMLPGFLRGLHREGQLRHMRCDRPVRVIWPERDRVLPYSAFGPRTMARLPGATLVRIAGAGHVPMYDQPAAVFRQIVLTTSSVG